MSTPTAMRSVTIAAEPDGPVSPTNGHRESSRNPLDPTDTAHVIDPLVANATEALTAYNDLSQSRSISS
jgi:hypothetical protein